VKEYIDREKLIAEYDRVHVGPAGGARKLMVDAPTEDVVEVVRCKDCKYWKQAGTERHACYILGFEMDYDEYCSYGERKEQG
jgi:hypothetical protein